MRRTYKGKHQALYGSAKVNRTFCHQCETYAFVIDGALQCCDTPLAENEIFEDVPLVRMSDVELTRRQLSPSLKKRILEEQDYRCLYCNRRLNSVVYRDGRPIRLKTHFDHALPFAFSLNNNPSNFVAACQICNQMKSDLVFNSLEDAQVYLVNRWEEKGYTINEFQDFITELEVD